MLILSPWRPLLTPSRQQEHALGLCPLHPSLSSEARAHGVCQSATHPSCPFNQSSHNDRVRCTHAEAPALYASYLECSSESPKGTSLLL